MKLIGYSTVFSFFYKCLTNQAEKSVYSVNVTSGSYAQSTMHAQQFNTFER